MRIVLLMTMLGGSTWAFESDECDKPPAGFEFATTAKTPAGKWLVRKDTEGNVLAQVDEDRTDGRFAIAVAKDSKFKDVKLSVRGKPISGSVDQAVGVVWRYRDAENYYVARSNVLERNVRVYRVVDGKRIKFGAKEDVDLKAGEWHTLGVQHKGKSIQVYLGKEKLIDAEDSTFADAGKIGVWTKADSVTYFDDLTAEELQ